MFTGKYQVKGTKIATQITPNCTLIEDNHEKQAQLFSIFLMIDL